MLRLSLPPFFSQPPPKIKIKLNVRRHKHNTVGRVVWADYIERMSQIKKN